MESNNNESGVPPVKPVEESQQSKDLRERLAKATGTKEAPKAGEKVKEKSFYDNDDFVEEPVTKEKPPVKPEERPTGKVTSKMKEASANSIIGLVDITNRIFIPIHNKRFQKKFSAEEVQKMELLVDRETEDITDKEELALKAKFERLIKKHNKKIDAIPLTEGEKTDLQTQLMAYMDYKEKTLPPEIGIAFAFVNILGKRIIDVATD